MRIRLFSQSYTGNLSFSWVEQILLRKIQQEVRNNQVIDLLAFETGSQGSFVRFPPLNQKQSCRNRIGSRL